jgi:hypothetical protein
VPETFNSSVPQLSKEKIIIIIIIILLSQLNEGMAGNGLDPKAGTFPRNGTQICAVLACRAVLFEIRLINTENAKYSLSGAQLYGEL